MDVIPFGPPFGWLCLIYMAWITTNLVLYGKPLPTAFKHGDILMTSALGTLVLTTLDLNADPIMSGLGCWDWPDGGPFFGVPIHNYIGWLFVGFVTLFMHGYMLRARKDRPSEKRLARAASFFDDVLLRRKKYTSVNFFCPTPSISGIIVVQMPLSKRICQRRTRTWNSRTITPAYFSTV